MACRGREKLSPLEKQCNKGKTRKFSIVRSAVSGCPNMFGCLGMSKPAEFRTSSSRLHIHPHPKRGNPHPKPRIRSQQVSLYQPPSRGSERSGGTMAGYKSFAVCAMLYVAGAHAARMPFDAASVRSGMKSTPNYAARKCSRP